MNTSAELPGRTGRARTWILLLAILAAALGIRLLSLTHEAVWFDEVTVLQPLDTPNLVEYVRQVVRSNPVPPGFMITQYLWSRLVGTEVAALRLWPVICGIAGLGALFLLTRRLLDDRAALLATLWLSFVYWHIHFSQELRYYPLSSLLALLSMWTFVELAAAPQPQRLALHALVNTCMVWTHPFTAFLCVAQAVFLLYFRRREHRLLVAWFGFHVLLALSLVVFVASLNRELASAQAGWIPTPALWGQSPSVYEFLAIASGIAPDAPPLNDAGRALVGVRSWMEAALVLLQIATVVFGARALLRARPAPDTTAAGALPPRETIALLLLWLLLPPTLVYLVSFVWRPMFIVRYLLFASFPVYMLLAHVLAVRPRLFTATALALLVAYDALFCFPGPTRTRFDQAAATIQSLSPAPKVIVLDDMLFQAPLEYYWRGKKPPMRPWIELDTLMSTTDFDLWVVYSSERRVRRVMQNAKGRGALAERYDFPSLHPLWVIHIQPMK